MNRRARFHTHDVLVDGGGDGVVTQVWHEHPMPPEVGHEHVAALGPAYETTQVPV